MWGEQEGAAADHGGEEHERERGERAGDRWQMAGRSGARGVPATVSGQLSGAKRTGHLLKSSIEASTPPNADEQ